MVKNLSLTPLALLFIPMGMLQAAETIEPAERQMPNAPEISASNAETAFRFMAKWG